MQAQECEDVGFLQLNYVVLEVVKRLCMCYSVPSLAATIVGQHVLVVAFTDRAGNQLPVFRLLVWSPEVSWQQFPSFWAREFSMSLSLSLSMKASRAAYVLSNMCLLGCFGTLVVKQALLV